VECLLEGLGLVLLNRPNDPCGGTRDYGARRDITGHHGPGSNDRVVGNPDPRKQNGVESYEDVASDGDPSDDVDVRVSCSKNPHSTVMGDEPHSGRDGDVVSNGNEVRLAAEGASVNADETAPFADPYAKMSSERDRVPRNRDPIPNESERPREHSSTVAVVSGTFRSARSPRVPLGSDTRHGPPPWTCSVARGVDGVGQTLLETALGGGRSQPPGTRQARPSRSQDVSHTSADRCGDFVEVRAGPSPSPASLGSLWLVMEPVCCEGRVAARNLRSMRG